MFSFVVLLKWLILGRVKPGLIWDRECSVECWRSDEIGNVAIGPIGRMSYRIACEALIYSSPKR